MASRMALRAAVTLPLWVATATANPIDDFKASIGQRQAILSQTTSAVVALLEATRGLETLAVPRDCIAKPDHVATTLGATINNKALFDAALHDVLSCQRSLLYAAAYFSKQLEAVTSSTGLIIYDKVAKAGEVEAVKAALETTVSALTLASLDINKATSALLETTAGECPPSDGDAVADRWLNWDDDARKAERDADPYTLRRTLALGEAERAKSETMAAWCPDPWGLYQHDAVAEIGRFSELSAIVYAANLGRLRKAACDDIRNEPEYGAVCAVPSNAIVSDATVHAIRVRIGKLKA